jgi:transcriptional regulator with XRE-family HTH domain
MTLPANADTVLPVGTESDIGFAAWLRRELEQRGYVLDGKRAGGKTRLANESGVNLSTISRIFSEDRVPETMALRKLGAVLGRTLGEMMVIAGQATADEMTISNENPAESRPVPTTQPPPDLPDSIDWTSLSDGQRDAWHVRGTSVSTRLTLSAVVEAQAAAEVHAAGLPARSAGIAGHPAKSA